MSRSELRKLCDEVLGDISAGELTEEQKADCWERAKRLKIVMPLEDFIEMNPDPSERVQYIISIWDQVEVPATLYTPK